MIEIKVFLIILVGENYFLDVTSIEEKEFCEI
jgi:hypothetical protein